jgi:hypothetical protein
MYVYFVHRALAVSHGPVEESSKSSADRYYWSDDYWSDDNQWVRFSNNNDSAIINLSWLLTAPRANKLKQLWHKQKPLARDMYNTKPTTLLGNIRTTRGRAFSMFGSYDGFHDSNKGL